jgi:hypothetical protein
MLQMDCGLGDCWPADALLRLHLVCARRMDPSPVHSWFELSYAQYLTIPRSVLQAMPHDWQCRFSACLSELDNAIDWRPKDGRYWVTLLPEWAEDHGSIPGCNDPLKDYRDYGTGQYIKNLVRRNDN